MMIISTTTRSFLLSSSRHNIVRRQTTFRYFAATSTTATVTASPPIMTKKQEQKQINELLSTSLPTVILKRNKQSKSFRDGSQLVFSGSIDKASSSIKLADLVLVDVPQKQKQRKNNDYKNQSSSSSPSSNQRIGIGVYNPNSMYRVRILYHHQLSTLSLNRLDDDDDDTESDEAFTRLILGSILMKSFQKAYDTRRAMMITNPLESDKGTDTYRLVNGEGDGISGLAVDVIGNKVVAVMSSAAWCQIHRDTILKCLFQILGDNYDYVWKTTPSRLKQDGYEEKQQEDGLESNDNDNKMVIATENGIKYTTYPYAKKGQKTSVYCDQRENRYNIAKLCHNKRVLDLCCYHGGFSLNAAFHGKAKSVTGIDSSQDAIDICYANTELNEFQDKTDINFIKSDISDYMKSCQDQYDVIVLDPPKLAPNLSTLPRASRKYHSLNRDAINLIDDEAGGLFLSCTCSSAMTQKDGGSYFLHVIQQAALSAGKQVTFLSKSGPAKCHTQSSIDYPSGNYLTAALFYVHPRD